MLNLPIPQQRSAGKLSTTFEPHVISKWLRREHNFCCGHGSSKCDKYLNSPDTTEEGLGERTHLEHIPQPQRCCTPQAGMKCLSSHFSLPANIMLRLVALRLWSRTLAWGNSCRASGSWFLSSVQLQHLLPLTSGQPEPVHSAATGTGWLLWQGCRRTGDISWGHTLEQSNGKVGETKGERLRLSWKHRTHRQNRSETESLGLENAVCRGG